MKLTLDGQSRDVSERVAEALLSWLEVAPVLDEREVATIKTYATTGKIWCEVSYTTPPRRSVA